MLPTNRMTMSDRLAVVRHWAKTCQQPGGHSDCAKYRLQSRRRPTRLIYLDPEWPDGLRLITTSSTEEYVYVTLSHRWGKEPFPEPPKLSLHEKPGDDAKWISIDKLETGVLQSSLSRTFRDALQIARQCDINYIWIDCLCIAQDKDSNGNNLDWDNEVIKMGDIYAGGAL